MNSKREPQSIAEILKSFNPLHDKYISREFQKYGFDLAEELGDLKHKALYIKFAKEIPRAVLEQARNYVKDARARSKARLFMWKLGELRKEYKKRKRANDFTEESV
jgi:ATP-dependent exoDNAse (exonuclease V) beta subunit